MRRRAPALLQILLALALAVAPSTSAPTPQPRLSDVFDLNTLELRRPWNAKVWNLTTRIRASPTELEPYLELVRTLHRAEHARPLSLAAVARRFQYLMHLILLLIMKELPRDSQDEMRRITSDVQDHMFWNGPWKMVTRGEVDALDQIPPELNSNHETVHVAIVVTGDYGTFAIPTLSSLLVRATCRVHLHALSDDEGWRSLSEALARARAAGKRLWTTALREERLVVSRVPFLEISALLVAANGLPSSCLALGLSNVVQVLLHVALPDTVDRVLLLDIGDVLVLGDVAELWSEFALLRPTELGAVAIISNLEKDRSNNMLGEHNPRRVRFVRKDGLPYDLLTTLNPAGASLWHLGRARSLGWTKIVQDIMRPLHHSCKVACMDIATHVFRRRQDLWRELSSAWHFQPDTPFYPEFSWDFRQHFGPLGFLSAVPLTMENPCPFEPLLHASLALLGQESFTDQQLEFAKLRVASMTQNYTAAVAHQKYFSSDLRCGSSIKLVHASGNVKFSAWWQHLFRTWGAEPLPQARQKSFAFVRGT